MPRRIVIFAAGSRGDLQPCLALGQGLAERGELVRLIASDRYQPMVTAAGLEHAAVSVDPTEILSTDEGQEWLAGGRNPVKFVANFKRILAPLAERLLAEVLVACKDADLILYPTIGFLGHHIAEQLRIPSALIHFQPSQPTTAFPHPLVPRSFGTPLNRFTFHAVDQITWQLLRPFINPWRRDSLGLPKLPLRGPMHRVRGGQVPVLCCFSPSVIPRPRDWPAYVHETGYWFVRDQPWAPTESLGSFIESGDPPVYVGFGSMVPKDPAATDRIVRAALRAAGLRGVLTTGEPDEDMYVVGDVPHSWLFPRMAAVVHHGGAGTTAAGLRAGVPSVICPFFGDQPYWGERVAALGAGPKPLPIREMTVDRLAEALRIAVAMPPPIELAERIGAEDGVARACDALRDLEFSTGRRIAR